MSEQKDEDRGKMYIFVKDKLRSGNEWLAFRVLMSNLTARDIPYNDDDSRLSGICSC